MRVARAREQCRTRLRTRLGANEGLKSVVSGFTTQIYGMVYGSSLTVDFPNSHIDDAVPLVQMYLFYAILLPVAQGPVHILPGLDPSGL